MEQKLKTVYASKTIEKRPLKYSLYSYDCPIQNLGQAKEGTKILHLSDLHFNVKDPSRIERLADLASFVSPDIVLLTGDYVTDSKHDLTPALDLLSQSFKDAQKYFVLGSHDVDPKHVSNPTHVNNALKDIGYINLDNTFIRDKNTGLMIYGVEDSKFKNPEVQYSRARDTNILITHKLDNINAYQLPTTDLILSGHLHDSEICLIPGLIDGTLFLRRAGDYSNRNKQGRKSWKTFGQRTLSHISPAFSRHFKEFGTKQKGATLISLVNE